MDPLVIAVASGKGGTGKTLVAMGLAATMASAGKKVVLVDCDVEAPNDHLFFEANDATIRPVSATVVAVDAAACTSCGTCRNACAFGAIRMFGVATVFEEMCHGCGLCVELCPTLAIREVSRRVGQVEIAQVGTDSGSLMLVGGRLDIGQVKTPAVIRASREAASTTGADVVILDAPPGIACAAVAALHGADYALLVTEPSPFGMHDLDLSLRLTRDLEIPCAVVVNRAGMGTVDVDTWAAEHDVPVALRIGFSRAIAEAYAQGELVTQVSSELSEQFVSLSEYVDSRVSELPACGSIT